MEANQVYFIENMTVTDKCSYSKRIFFSNWNKFCVLTRRNQASIRSIKKSIFEKLLSNCLMLIISDEFIYIYK